MLEARSKRIMLRLNLFYNINTSDTTDTPKKQVMPGLELLAGLVKECRVSEGYLTRGRSDDQIRTESDNLYTTQPMVFSLAGIDLNCLKLKYIQYIT